MRKSICQALLFSTLLLAWIEGLHAQNYVLIPGDTIVAQVVTDDLSVFNIMQENASTDTLYLAWEKVSDVLQGSWSAMICDNSVCYPDLKDSGSMLPVLPGEYGLLSLHITALAEGGEALIRYAVWEINNPLEKDTLTWIINSVITGVGAMEDHNLYTIVSGNQLLIHSSQNLKGTARLLNLQGTHMITGTLSGAESHINIGRLPSGIYILELAASTNRIRSKIWIER